MFTPSLRLESDGLAPLVLSAASGYIPQALDLGFPVVRQVAQNAPDADGSIDTTRFFGARNITLPLVLDETISGEPLEAMEDRLRAFLAPSRRSVMIGLFRAGGGERRAVVRGSQFASVVTGLDHRPVTAQWVCPSGLLESAEGLIVSGVPGDNQPQAGGATFPWTFNLTFGSSAPSTNGVVVTNGGNVPAWPAITMYGPMTDPTVLNETTGLQLVFDGLTIATGDWVRIDFAGKTILNSVGTSYYAALDFASSKWWQLQPGNNRIFVVPVTSTIPPASFDVTWRNSWL